MTLSQRHNQSNPIHNNIVLDRGFYRSFRNLSLENLPATRRLTANSFRPGQPRQSSTVYGKSFSMGYMSTPNTFVEQWIIDNNVRFNYNYTARMVTIFFHMSIPSNYLGRISPVTTYKVEFHIKSLVNGEITIEQFDETGDHIAFTMNLIYPGKFWKEVSGITLPNGSHRANKWERLTSLNGNNNIRIDEIQLDGAQLGAWTTYRVEFFFDGNYKSRQCYKTLIKHIAEQKAIPRDPIRSGIKINIAAPSSATATLNHQERFRRIPHFETFYTLESFITSYRLHEHNLTEEFYTTLCRLPPFVAIEALKLICFKEDTRVWNPLETLKNLVNTPYYTGLQNLHRRRSRVAYVYKAMVTPTTLQLGLPQPEMTNRVIRHFKQYGDRFLRVQFVEEGLAPLINTASTKFLISDALFERIFQVITQGIHIGNRHYEFLAFSSSQLRSHGCWFFCATDDLNADKIRQWMGDFQKERVVAKHAARMGQVW